MEEDFFVCDLRGCGGEGLGWCWEGVGEGSEGQEEDEDTHLR